MAAVAPVVLAPLELHDEDLALLPLGHHLGGDPGAGQRGGLDGDVAVAIDQEHLLELHRGALGLIEALDLDHLPGSHPVLLAAGCDDRFHNPPPTCVRRAVSVLPRAPMRPQAAAESQAECEVRPPTQAGAGRLRPPRGTSTGAVAGTGAS